MVELAPNLLVAGRFLLKRPLARGGMGSLWVAEHVELKAPCALKFVGHPGGKAGEVSEAFRLRFAREARALARLRSTHVVQVFDFGEWGDVPFLAMELLEGEDLAGRLAREGRLGGPLCVEVAGQLARGLA